MKRYLLLTHAVIDESGKFKDKDIICLSGLLAPPDVWEAITQQWGEKLRKHSIDYLHLKELRRWDGIYRNRKEEWGESGREAVLLDFAEVVRNRSPLSVMLHVSLDAKAWRAMSSEHRRRIGRPDLTVFDLFIAFLLFTGDVALPGGFDVSLTCDDDEETALLIYKLWRLSKLRNPIATRLRSLSFCDDRTYPALQLADLAANTFYREVIRRTTDPAIPHAELFKAMVGGTRVYHKHIDEQLLKEMASSPQGFIFYLEHNPPRPVEWVV